MYSSSVSCQGVGAWGQCHGKHCFSSSLCRRRQIPAPESPGSPGAAPPHGLGGQAPGHGGSGRGAGLRRNRPARVCHPVWPENSIRRIPSSTKGYISVRNFGICDPASVPETPRIKQETPKSWTRRIPPARQPFMTAACQPFMTTRLDRAGEVGHCWFIQPAREISRKRNGSRHFDIGSSHYRRSQGVSPAVSDRSSFRAIRGCQRTSAGR